jgi:hypothetical protein
MRELRRMSRGVTRGLLSDGRSWIGEATDAYEWMSAHAVNRDAAGGYYKVVAYRTEEMARVAVPIGAPFAADLVSHELSGGRTSWTPGLFWWAGPECTE